MQTNFCCFSVLVLNVTSREGNRLLKKGVCVGKVSNAFILNIRKCQKKALKTSIYEVSEKLAVCRIRTS